MSRIAISIIVLSLLLPPVLAAWLGGQELPAFLDFPFITAAATHKPFSWPVWFTMVVFVVIVALPFLSHTLRFKTGVRYPGNKRNFPAWGYIAIILLIISWVLAWSRFSWFASLQVYTFTPLWLCYIAIINAMTFQRKGHCLLSRQPLYLLALFFISSVFWWYYEFLNGFIRNWHYVNIEQLTETRYAFHATLAFSTVLPAVISTTELLDTVPRISQSFASFRALRITHSRPLAVIGWIAASMLLGIAIRYPEQLFMLVWIAPLFIIVGVRHMLGHETLFSSLAGKDWRPVVIPALAALLCGFFWELWNSMSFAHWEYNIPYVDRFHLFEMPLIGYAGYLPFGMVCLALSELLPATNGLFTPHLEEDNAGETSGKKSA